MACIDTEIGRLGGMDAVLDLLRKKENGKADPAFAKRIELGTALLVCRIKGRAERVRECGTTTSFSPSDGGAGQISSSASRDDIDTHSIATKDTAWQPTSLSLALDAVQGRPVARLYLEFHRRRGDTGRLHEHSSMM